MPVISPGENSDTCFFTSLLSTSLLNLGRPHLQASLAIITALVVKVGA